MIHTVPYIKYHILHKYTCTQVLYLLNIFIKRDKNICLSWSRPAVPCRGGVPVRDPVVAGQTGELGRRQGEPGTVTSQHNTHFYFYISQFF